MQYLFSVIDDSTNSGTSAERAAIDVFNDRLQAEGCWVFDNRDGAAVVTDGPFVETKEHMAGFWIIEAPDLDVALKLATEGSKACNRRVEVRPFLGD
jgi:hypothetical protein